MSGKILIAGIYNYIHSKKEMFKGLYEAVFKLRNNLVCRKTTRLKSGGEQALLYL